MHIVYAKLSVWCIGIIQQVLIKIVILKYILILYENKTCKLRWNFKAKNNI